jgi:sugar phosphate isomerase/epimerase
LSNLIQNKIGFRLSGYRQVPLDDALNSIAVCGYDGVELCLEHPDLDPDNSARGDAERINHLLSQAELEVSAVSFHGKNAGWEAKHSKCRYGIQLAHELGCHVFVSGSVLGQSPELFAEMCRFTGEMCSIVDDYGISFAVEPEPGTIIEGSREMRALLETVVSDRLKLNLDVGHAFLTEPDLYDDIKSWNDLIVHTHIEDIKKGIHQHLLPGKGDIDFTAVMRALNELKYDGYLTIDLFDILDNPQHHAREAIEALWEKANLA